MSIAESGPERVMRIQGAWSRDTLGYVNALGDVNGDGLGDLGIAGAYFDSETARAYVVFGRRDPVAKLNLRDLGRGGFVVTATEGSRFSGFHWGMAGGDLDGDGARDIALAQTVESDAEFRVMVVFGKGGRSEGGFVRGETNGDGEVDLSDALFVLTHLFLEGPDAECLDALDIDDSGVLDLTDPIALLGHLFLGTRDPPAPFPGCGADPTDDLLGCGGAVGCR